tara:strand:+ start:29516 stop:30631 length:1116 start_codon:yes stop_codon:yes gene_type:complete
VIALVYPELYGVQGIARYIDSFLKNLPENHPKIYVITGDKSDVVSREYTDRIEIINIPFKKGRFSLFLWSFAARKKITELYKQGKVELVNFHIPPMIPGLFLPRSIHHVLTLHTTYLGMSGKYYPTQYYDSQWSDSEVFVKKLIEKYVLSYTDKVITLTEQGKSELDCYGYRGEVDIIPNGADLSRFTPTESEKKYDIIFSGRIESRKGSRSMVQFCEQVIQEKEDIKIVIVGYGDDDEFVNQQLKKYSKNILLTGKVPFDEMVDYYNQSKVYVSTSYYEGLPGTCIEAMSMKLPVVVWDLLFYKELVTDGINGRLAEVNRMDSLVKQTLGLLSDERCMTQFGENGRVTVSERYDWKRLSPLVLASMTGRA